MFGSYVRQRKIHTAHQRYFHCLRAIWCPRNPEDTPGELLCKHVSGFCPWLTCLRVASELFTKADAKSAKGLLKQRPFSKWACWVCWNMHITQNWESEGERWEGWVKPASATASVTASAILWVQGYAWLQNFCIWDTSQKTRGNKTRAPPYWQKYREWELL